VGATGICVGTTGSDVGGTIIVVGAMGIMVGTTGAGVGATGVDVGGAGTGLGADEVEVGATGFAVGGGPYENRIIYGVISRSSSSVGTDTSKSPNERRDRVAFSLSSFEIVLDRNPLLVQTSKVMDKNRRVELTVNILSLPFGKVVMLSITPQLG
jgi:hypothetical protein